MNLCIWKRLNIASCAEKRGDQAADAWAHNPRAHDKDRPSREYQTALAVMRSMAKSIVRLYPNG